MQMVIVLVLIKLFTYAKANTSFAPNYESHKVYGCTKFGDSGLFGFGDFVPFQFLQKRPKFPFRPWTIVRGVNK